MCDFILIADCEFVLIMSSSVNVSPARAAAQAAARATEEEELLERYGQNFIDEIAKKPVSWNDWQTLAARAKVTIRSGEQMEEAARWCSIMRSWHGEN